MVLNYKVKNGYEKVMGVRGEWPPPMFGHSAVVTKNQIIVTGGNKKNSVWIFEIDRRRWFQFALLALDVEGHTSAIIGDALLVFGGKDSKGNFSNNVLQIPKSTISLP
jgi:N-acetylneuraminic acid mutarotase